VGIGVVVSAVLENAAPANAPLLSADEVAARVRVPPARVGGNDRSGSRALGAQPVKLGWATTATATPGAAPPPGPGGPGGVGGVGQESVAGSKVILTLPLPV
jgi:hypothetical protein